MSFKQVPLDSKEIRHGVWRVSEMSNEDFDEGVKIHKSRNRRV